VKDWTSLLVGVSSVELVYRPMQNTAVFNMVPELLITHPKIL